jgi:hypothetical protein
MCFRRWPVRGMLLGRSDVGARAVFSLPRRRLPRSTLAFTWVAGCFSGLYRPPKRPFRDNEHGLVKRIGTNPNPKPSEVPTTNICAAAAACIRAAAFSFENDHGSVNLAKKAPVCSISPSTDGGHPGKSAVAGLLLPAATEWPESLSNHRRFNFSVASPRP